MGDMIYNNGGETHLDYERKRAIDFGANLPANFGRRSQWKSLLRPSVSEYRAVQFGMQARPVRNLVKEGPTYASCTFFLGSEPKHKR